MLITACPYMKFFHSEGQLTLNMYVVCSVCLHFAMANASLQTSATEQPPDLPTK